MLERGDPSLERGAVGLRPAPTVVTWGGNPAKWLYLAVARCRQEAPDIDRLVGSDCSRGVSSDPDVPDAPG